MALKGDTAEYWAYTHTSNIESGATEAPGETKSGNITTLNQMWELLNTKFQGIDNKLETLTRKSDSLELKCDKISSIDQKIEDINF